MKNHFSVLMFVAIAIGVVNAQDKNKENRDKKFSMLNLGNRLQDSIPQTFQFHVDSMLNKKDGSVSIPNAFEKDIMKMNYNMPIKKLSGENLAPMPGTEELGKRIIKGSKRIFNPYKK